jgi:hypothetical protein
MDFDLPTLSASAPHAVRGLAAAGSESHTYTLPQRWVGTVKKPSHEAGSRQDTGSDPALTLHTSVSPSDGQGITLTF